LFIIACPLLFFKWCFFLCPYLQPCLLAIPFFHAPFVGKCQVSVSICNSSFLPLWLLLFLNFPPRFSLGHPPPPQFSTQVVLSVASKSNCVTQFGKLADVARCVLHVACRRQATTIEPQSNSQSIKISSGV